VKRKPTAKGGAPKTGDSKSQKPRGTSSEEDTDDERLFLEAIERFKPSEARKSADRASTSSSTRHSQGRAQDTGRQSSVTQDIASIDLHGLTLVEAIRRVDQFINAKIRSARGVTRLRVITGKGSREGKTAGVLAEEIHHHVVQKYAMRIRRIDESPAKVLLGGRPIRGHFDVDFGPASGAIA